MGNHCGVSRLSRSRGPKVPAVDELQSVGGVDLTAANSWGCRKSELGPDYVSVRGFDSVAISEW